MHKMFGSVRPAQQATSEQYDDDDDEQQAEIKCPLAATLGNDIKVSKGCVLSSFVSVLAKKQQCQWQ